MFLRVKGCNLLQFDYYKYILLRFTNLFQAVETSFILIVQKPLITLCTMLYRLHTSHRLVNNVFRSM